MVIEIRTTVACVQDREELTGKAHKELSGVMRTCYVFIFVRMWITLIVRIGENSSSCVLQICTFHCM